MKSLLKKIHIRFFDWPLDFRVRLFHILAFGGIAISFFTVTISLIMGMWETAGLAAVLIVPGADSIHPENGQVSDSLLPHRHGHFHGGFANDVLHLGRSPQRNAIDFPSGCTLYSADDKGKGGAPDFPAGNRGIFRRVRFCLLSSGICNPL